MLPSAQSRVIGKYRVVREIGRGGVGVVYEAENTWTHRRVALKVLSGMAAADVPSRERFLREARTAGRLVHPNVVAMIDADMEKDGSIYIVQELLVGEDLETKLEREGPFEAKEIAKILLPIMDALSSAHAAGIVHRDIKPSNVFLTKVGKNIEPKLIDFGLSKLVGVDVRITTQGMVLGTPAYMSPEQFYEPDTVDHRSDVWAMAVMWWECITQRLPFDGTSPAEIAGKVVSGKRPKLREVGRSIPQPLAEAIERGLLPREARWQSIAEMRASLSKLLGFPAATGTGASTPPPPMDELDIEVEVDVDDTISSEPTAVRTATGPQRTRGRVSRPPEDASDERATLEPRPSTAAYGISRDLVTHGMRAIRFGVVPSAVGFDDPSVGEQFGRTIGVPVVVLRFGGYDELIDALREKRLEAAWMSPVAFVRAAASGLASGSLTVLRGGQSNYVSVLLGHTARVKTLDARSLRGKTAAWVDRWSASGYLMPRRILRERGVDPNATLKRQLSVMSYEAVVDCLVAGTADLGGVFGWRNVDGALWHFGAKHQELSVLAVSDPIPSDVLALHAELPPSVGEAIAQGFARARPEDPGTRGLLAAVSADGFTKFDRKRYEWIARAVREDEHAADGPKAQTVISAEVSDLDWD